MIKPDAVARGVVGQIISRFETMGFAILKMEMKRLSRDEAERFYEPHRAKDFYGKLVDFITSGPVVGLLLEREGAVSSAREIIGSTDPGEAAEGTLRRLFGTDITQNAVHASDSPENVLREAGIFFGTFDP
ncbi:MAG: nucleoside-diphosphate kinase [candidate division WOR-3 bacterium]